MSPEQIIRLESELLQFRCELNGMVAVNIQRQWEGERPRFTESNFDDLKDRVRTVTTQFTHQ